MQDFGGRIAVITGGGTGMGRELAHQLSAEGCHVALCDVVEAAMAETARRCQADAPAGTKVTTFLADVGDEAQLVAFKDHVVTALDTGHVHLLFNNAGIGGGASMVVGDRAEWERTFNVDWYGVYYGTRTFLPLLLNAEAGHVVNTSSVNGFYAALGPAGAHTAYSAAKFAVKGFTEALVTDFRVNAPHLHAHVVMPGHIGTDIVGNTVRVLAGADGEEQAAAFAPFSDGFRDLAPTTAADAARIILDAVRANRWRILVGADAEALDAAVREDPEAAYEPGMWAALQADGHFGGGLRR
jgi:NAD(P)-dependent dehydrogenase (short-subunit alcohol dehydrogenase family)